MTDQPRTRNSGVRQSDISYLTVPKRFLIVSALLLCTPVGLFAANPSERLARAIQSKDWQQGLLICDGLPQSESRRADRLQSVQPVASHFAKLSALCAAVASGAGDRWRSNWWWFAAAAMDVKTTQNLLPELQSQGLLLDLLPVRSPAHRNPTDHFSETQVLLVNGEVVTGTQARPLNPPKIPLYLHSRVPGVARAQVVVEVVVDEDGLPWQPVLVSAQALPVHAFLVFVFAGNWRFSPAVVNGAPVASAYLLTVTMEVKTE